MNQKAFTLTELLVSMVIITMLLMIALPTINNIINRNNDELYSSYEDMVEEYAKISSQKDNDRILLSDIDGIDRVIQECTGYVLVDKTTSPYTYNAFIKCGNKYQTENYIE